MSLVPAPRGPAVRALALPPPVDAEPSVVDLPLLVRLDELLHLL